MGKDYAHAAHLALTAHGHALKAFWHGNEAQKRYQDLGISSPEPPKRIFDNVVDAARTLEAKLSVAQDHTAAADDHDEAARHEQKAALHNDANDRVKAAYEGSIAHVYARHAIFHGDEAAMHHVEHYGRAGPTAEIA